MIWKYSNDVEIIHITVELFKFQNTQHSVTGLFVGFLKLESWSITQARPQTWNPAISASKPVVFSYFTAIPCENLAFDRGEDWR